MSFWLMYLVSYSVWGSFLVYYLTKKPRFLNKAFRLAIIFSLVISPVSLMVTIIAIFVNVLKRLVRGKQKVDVFGGIKIDDPNK